MFDTTFAEDHRLLDAGSATQEQEKAIAMGAGLVAGNGLRVRSGAGTGKTTTLIAMARAMMPRRGVYVAFNRTVAQEARPKFAGTGCVPKTFHSMCLGTVRSRMSGDPVRYDVRGDIIEPGLIAPWSEQILHGWSAFSIGLAVLRTVESFCHSADTRIEAHHARAAITALTGDPDTLVSIGPRKIARRSLAHYSPILVDIARVFWDARMSDRRFSHDVYVKLVHLDDSLRAQTFAGLDYVMADEAQDLNPVQVAILRQSGISVIAVGDSAQSIHGWRGAIDALDRLDGAETCLSRSFRFGAGIAGMANHVLSAMPEPHHGVHILGAGGQQALPANTPGHAILARSNMGLLDEAMMMQARGLRYHFDRADETRASILSALALKQGRRGGITVPEMRAFSCWQDFAEEAQFNPAHDRLYQIVEENRAESIVSMLDGSLPFERASVCLMTAHRAKGLEFGAVKLAQDWSSLADMKKSLDDAATFSAQKLLQARQEYNVLYVALTRAIRKIVGAESLL